MPESQAAESLASPAKNDAAGASGATELRRRTERAEGWTVWCRLEPALGYDTIAEQVRDYVLEYGDAYGHDDIEKIAQRYEAIVRARLENELEWSNTAQGYLVPPGYWRRSYSYGDFSDPIGQAVHEFDRESALGEADAALDALNEKSVEDWTEEEHRTWWIIAMTHDGNVSEEDASFAFDVVNPELRALEVGRRMAQGATRDAAEEEISAWQEFLRPLIDVSVAEFLDELPSHHSAPPPRA
jgi:hypothetical protein